MLTERRLDRTRWVLWGLTLLAIGIAAGAGRIWLSDFFAINGDFQNYNVLRRFLDGQVPYRDFTNYLGMGVLWLDAPFLAFHNTFTGSLFVTNAVTAVCCCVTVWLLVWMITRRQTLAMAVGALTPLLYAWPVTATLFDLFVPGTSMRMVRGFLPVLLGAVLLLAARRRGWDSLDLFRSRKAMALCGLAVGLGAVWSNDFGYSSIGAALFILLVITVFQNRLRTPGQRAADYLCFLLCAAVGYLVMVTAVTGGDPASFFRQSAGVASDQFWYYTMTPGKYYTLWEILFDDPQNTAELALALLFMAGFVALFVRGKLTVRGVVVLYVLITCFFAQLLYCYGSGHYMPAMLRLVEVLILLGLALWAALRLWTRLVRTPGLPRRAVAGLSAGVMCLSLLCAGVWAGREIAPLSGQREGVYVPGLDGWLTNGAELNATAELLEGEIFFSTYASALEVVDGIYQPSGTDYIIHVLGEEQRQDYLNCFREGEYPYAVTIQRYYDESIWEWWVQRANWWFYRELYANYVTVDSPSDYAELWRRQEGGALIDSDDITFTVERLSDTAVRLSAEKGPSLAGKEVVADVALTYETERTGWSLRHGVMVEDLSLWDYDNTVYFLPEGEHTVHIPMVIKDGVWSVTIHSRPGETTKLASVEAEVERLFDQDLMGYAFFG